MSPAGIILQEPSSDTNAIGASLPPELLACIAAHAFNNLSSFDRQTERFAYSQVCRSWYIGFQTVEDFSVESLEQALRLAARLEETNGGAQV